MGKSFGVKTKKDLSPIDREGKSKNDEIVDILLPPREWIETGKNFTEYVSK
jgi:hypothetical protein